MQKQAIVLGVGQLGMALARALAREGAEVIVVDLLHDLVQEASAFVAQALRLDATDEQALASLEPARRDLCVVTIGSESRESSILATALLRQLGAPRIIARASDPLLERILHLVGAHEVINPEQALGERLARRMMHQGIVDELPLGDDLIVSEIQARSVMVGRTPLDLDLPGRFGLTLLGIRAQADDGSVLLPPDPERPFAPSDALIIAGPRAATVRCLERWR